MKIIDSILKPIRKKMPNYLFNTIDQINKYSAYFAGVLLILVILLIIANSLMRQISAPIAGITELVGWLSANIIAFSLGYAYTKNGHTTINLLFNKFPLKLQVIIHRIMTLISAVFFSIIFWGFIEYGFELKENNILSATFKISIYPILFLTSIGLVGIVLGLIKHIFLFKQEED